MSTAHTSSKIIVDALWKQAQSRVRVPQWVELHTAHDDLLAHSHTAHQSFDRYQWSTRCILLHDDILFGVITRDISRSGLGFYSPIEIRPGEMAELVLPGLRVLRVQGLNTTKLDAECFECGVCFKGNPE